MESKRAGGVYRVRWFQHKKMSNPKKLKGTMPLGLLLPTASYALRVGMARRNELCNAPLMHEGTHIRTEFIVCRDVFTTDLSWSRGYFNHTFWAWLCK